MACPLLGSSPYEKLSPLRQLCTQGIILGSPEPDFLEAGVGGTSSATYWLSDPLSVTSLLRVSDLLFCKMRRIILASLV